ncbi:MAG: hypothetical protein GY835_04840 [bacterium]|nr:hypothetical protein [bacterium]
MRPQLWPRVDDAPDGGHAVVMIEKIGLDKWAKVPYYTPAVREHDGRSF